MPSIVIVVDEVGDLLMSMKKEVESSIIRLAQKSRAAGIHLILATQKPTVDVITGLIKSNLPARICFQVASRADSAVVLDEKGAEKLLGMGDMLFLQPGTSTIVRAQGAYVDDKEIVGVVETLEVYEPNFESELLNLKARDAAGGGDFGDRLRDRDPMYEQAIEIVIREQRGSTSLLQRALGVGYGRASRLIDFMAEDGLVGGYNGSNARDVLVTPEEWESRKKGA
jgi:S-DNA-T family DNA segregation ATPase FtsK/SpoIIIE